MIINEFYFSCNAHPTYFTLPGLAALVTGTNFAIYNFIIAVYYSFTSVIMCREIIEDAVYTEVAQLFKGSSTCSQVSTLNIYQYSMTLIDYLSFRDSLNMLHIKSFQIYFKVTPRAHYTHKSLR